MKWILASQSPRRKALFSLIFGKTRMTAVVKTKLRSTFKMTAGIVRFVEYRYVEIKVFNAIIINPKAYIGIT